MAVVYGSQVFPTIHQFFIRCRPGETPNTWDESAGSETSQRGKICRFFKWFLNGWTRPHFPRIALYQWIGLVGKILTGNPWVFTIQFFWGGFRMFPVNFPIIRFYDFKDVFVGETIEENPPFGWSSASGAMVFAPKARWSTVNFPVFGERKGTLRGMDSAAWWPVDVGKSWKIHRWWIFRSGAARHTYGGTKSMLLEAFTKPQAYTKHVQSHKAQRNFCPTADGPAKSCTTQDLRWLKSYQ